RRACKNKSASSRPLTPDDAGPHMRCRLCANDWVLGRLGVVGRMTFTLRTSPVCLDVALGTIRLDASGGPLFPASAGGALNRPDSIDYHAGRFLTLGGS